MNARALSATIIYKVCFENISLTEAFEQIHLPEEDRGFIKEMCFGTIRYWITLQAILKNLLEKPLKKTDKDIECLLCVGLYQILYMHTADHAAVNETVSATRVLKKAWAAGLVNKILRLAIDNKANVDGTRAQASREPFLKSMTAKYAHPNWIIEKLQKAYPEKWEAILAANNQKAPLFLRVNQRLISRDDFLKLLASSLSSFTSSLSSSAHAEDPQKKSGLSAFADNDTKGGAGNEMKRGEDNNANYVVFDDLPHCILIKNPIPVEKIPGFFEGYFSVQDMSGQRVIDYLDLKPGQTVLDACAAPGSKTTHILETMPTLKKLVAVDLYENRLKKVKENIKRLKLASIPSSASPLSPSVSLLLSSASTSSSSAKAEDPHPSLDPRVKREDDKCDVILDCIAADICDLKSWWNGEKFDRILLDAPCSASGVIRRHPDIKLLRKKTDIPKLVETQLKMLETLWPLLKEDGKLIYSTCSIFPEENQGVIERFLKTHPEATLVFEKQVLPKAGDGFYYVTIECTA